ncbi:MAG TPA: glycosyltransferase family 39 protein, partial [Candidatus Methylomirabilis sp.]|nr:glycosyltransferase family 39 protein [Candidatus Methylomirabilis sp.]
MERVRRGGGAWDWLWFLAWGVASSIWCVTAASQLGATFDEPFYVASGLEHWRTGSHRSLLKKGTMPLPIDVFTLPLALRERWSGVPFDPALDLERLLPWARAGTLVFWWLLLLYAWRIGRQLAGPWGGRLSVAWVAAEPNLLAHASLATTDVAVTACLLALLYHFRTGREEGWLRRVGVPTVWYAAAVLSKASALVLGPVCLLVVEVERLIRADRAAPATRGSGIPAGLRQGLERLRPFRRDLARILIGGLVIVFVYSGSDWRQEPSFVAWARSLPDGLAGQVMVWVSEHLRIFSNAGEGLVKQITHNVRGHGAYLLGHTYRRAVWFYFPVLLTIKLTLPLLIMPVVLALTRPRSLVNWASLVTAVLLVLSLTFRVQIGIRLVLPLVALGVVGLAAAVVQASRDVSGWVKRLLIAGAGAGVVWTATAALLVWPHGLSYVNELWGGTARGYLV